MLMLMTRTALSEGSELGKGIIVYSFIYRCKSCSCGEQLWNAVRVLSGRNKEPKQEMLARSSSRCMLYSPRLPGFWLQVVCDILHK